MERYGTRSVGRCGQVQLSAERRSRSELPVREPRVVVTDWDDLRRRLSATLRALCHDTPKFPGQFIFHVESAVDEKRFVSVWNVGGISPPKHSSTIRICPTRAGSSSSADTRKRSVAAALPQHDFRRARRPHGRAVGGRPANPRGGPDRPPIHRHRERSRAVRHCLPPRARPAAR